MAPETINPLIIIAAVVGVGLVAGYFIVRYLKGSITILVEKGSFYIGDLVKGSFQLVTRQEVRGNKLFVSVVATESRRERGYNGKSHTHTREVFRNTQVLEQAKVYPAGYTATYNFELPLPSTKPSSGYSGDSMLGQTLGLLGGSGTSLSWKVEARLDAEGVDLASSESIFVEGSSTFGI